MAQFPNPYQPAQPLDYGRQLDAGVVARFFNSVYAWMAAGLAVTAAVAWWVSTQPNLMAQVFHGPVLLILIIGQLALVWAVAGAINRINATAATALFMLYSALNGLTLSVILLVYAQAVIASAFVVTAGT